MNHEILISNLTNLCCFLLGCWLHSVKSDLTIPESTSKFFIAVFIIFHRFKGGQELSHSGINTEIAITLLLAVVFACAIPFLILFYS
jgi:hypothetical protein